VDCKIKRTKRVVVKKEDFFSNFDKEKGNGAKWKHFEVGILIMIQRGMNA
jgi:hypothetical protein